MADQIPRDRSGPPPRVTFRCTSWEEYDDIARASRVAGVPVGAMARVCAVNWCAFVAAEKAAGREWGFTRRANGGRE